MSQSPLDQAIRRELYLTLLLLGAEPMLLAGVAAWRDVENTDSLRDLRNWNEAKLLELKEWLSTLTEHDAEAVRERIRQYEDARRAQPKEEQRAA
jgi:hypothetical protein